MNFKDKGPNDLDKIIFNLSPPNKLSTPSTSYFLLRSSLQMCEPRNPAAPVTKIVLAIISFNSSFKFLSPDPMI